MDKYKFSEKEPDLIVGHRQVSDIWSFWMIDGSDMIFVTHENESALTEGFLIDQEKFEHEIEYLITEGSIVHKGERNPTVLKTKLKLTVRKYAYQLTSMYKDFYRTEITAEVIKELIEELRINMEEINRVNVKEEAVEINKDISV